MDFLNGIMGFSLFLVLLILISLLITFLTSFLKDRKMEIKRIEKLRKEQELDEKISKIKISIEAMPYQDLVKEKMRIKAKVFQENYYAFDDLDERERIIYIYYMSEIDLPDPDYSWGYFRLEDEIGKIIRERYNGEYVPREHGIKLVWREKFRDGSVSKDCEILKIKDYELDIEHMPYTTTRSLHTQELLYLKRVLSDEEVENIKVTVYENNGVKRIGVYGESLDNRVFKIK